jgi:hypothetical protein
METAEGTTRPTQITEGAIGEDPPEVARWGGAEGCLVDTEAAPVAMQHPRHPRDSYVVTKQEKNLPCMFQEGGWTSQWRTV